MTQTTNFLTGLKKLPELKPLRQTFMEIAGYPHFENVCSNILQFYLQPSNEHGFDSLLLNALATLIDREILTDEQIITVRREEPTAEGKRIDLVIESDNFVLGIENKIFAGTYNPFNLYAQHLESLSNGRKVYKVLLSLRPIKLSCELCGFIPIDYNSFFKEVRVNINKYSATADRQHQIFLLDFIQTIQNLQQGSTMDRQRLEYFQIHREEIDNFLTEVDELTKDMERKVKLLAEINNTDISTYSNIKQGFWNSWQELTHVVWYEFIIDESLKIHLDICLTSTGWKIRFYILSKNSQYQAQQWFKNREIDIDSFGSGRLANYIGKDNLLAYETNLEDVKVWTLNMLERLITSIELETPEN